MAHINFSVDDQAFRACTRGIVQPHQINSLATYYHHITQIFDPLQGEPEIGEDEAEYFQVLNCLMDTDAMDTDALETFRECEYYRITRDSEELDDALDDDSDGEELMEDKEGSEADADHINPDE